MADPVPLLILGGTAEGLALARRAGADPRLAVTYSLAGRTAQPERPDGAVRIGGFGGAEGLEAWLRDRRIGLVVDATHPFATRISDNAAAACERMGVARIAIRRSPWTPVDGDRWHEVDTPSEAVDALRPGVRRAFLTVGRRQLDPFAVLGEMWFLVRLIEVPETPPPLANHRIITARGPFDEDGETRLMEENGIDCLVTRNAGGTATYAKIAAARALGLAVVMLRTPPPPTGNTVATVDGAMDWIAATLA